MSLLSSSRFGGGGGQQQNSELESQIVNTVKQVDPVTVLVSLSNSLSGRIWMLWTSSASGCSPVTRLPKIVQVSLEWTISVLRR